MYTYATGNGLCTNVSANVLCTNVSANVLCTNVSAQVYPHTYLVYSARILVRYRHVSTAGRHLNTQSDSKSHARENAT